MEWNAQVGDGEGGGAGRGGGRRKGGSAWAGGTGPPFPRKKSGKENARFVRALGSWYGLARALSSDRRSRVVFGKMGGKVLRAVLRLGYPERSEWLKQMVVRAASASAVLDRADR